MAEKRWVCAAAPAHGSPGDVSRNLDAALERVREAKAAGALLLALPELCLTGDCGDLMRHGALQDACRQAALRLVRETGGMLCVFGLPLLHDGRLYNAAAVARDGRLTAFVVKQRLGCRHRALFEAACPDGAVFGGGTVPCVPEGRYALPGGAEADAWVVFYDDLPLLNTRALPENRGTVLALPARIPAKAGGSGPLLERLEELARGGVGIAFANAGANESTTDEVFDGLCAAAAGGGLDACAPFSFGMASAQCRLGAAGSALQVPETPAPPRDPRMPYAPPPGDEKAAWCMDCLEIPARGLAARMARIGARALTLGVSGGLDSAMALMIARRAFELMELPLDGLYACSLPGLGSSRRTRGNALALMRAMGLQEREIDLQESIRLHLRDIGQDEGLHDAAFENAQARERTQVLMDKANQLGGLMAGTGDLSELALGFTTFGGDHLSMYGVNAGLYKTAIRLVLAHLAQKEENAGLRGVLADILDTPVSPELLPAKDGAIAQKTEDILGPYLVNDFFLHLFLAEDVPPEALLARAEEAFRGEYGREALSGMLARFFRRFFRSQFKRSCLPDGPAPLGVSLSPRGFFAMPSDMSAEAWLGTIDGDE